MVGQMMTFIGILILNLSITKTKINLEDFVSDTLTQ